MSKLELKFACYLLFCCLPFFLKKKKVLLWNFGIKIMQLFLYFEDAPKLISQIQIKNTITKIFKIWRKFHHSTTCSNDMIQTISNKNYFSSFHLNKVAHQSKRNHLSWIMEKRNMEDISLKMWKPLETLSTCFYHSPYFGHYLINR